MYEAQKKCTKCVRLETFQYLLAKTNARSEKPVPEFRRLDDNGNEKLRVADNLPTCNIAFAASAYEVFSDMQLVVNGSVFTSQPNRFQGMLDRVYRGRDVLSFQSGGALKPIVNRNLKTATEANGIFPVQGARADKFVQIHDTYSSVSRNAFSI